MLRVNPLIKPKEINWPDVWKMSSLFYPISEAGAQSLPGPFGLTRFPGELFPPESITYFDQRYKGEEREGSCQETKCKQENLSSLQT